jgi:hypothetical protein
MIRVEWGNESETAGDFAGYRVYRAEGDWWTHIPEGETSLIGAWEIVYECGVGTGNPVTFTYEDTTAKINIAYFYAVTAFDDGQTNIADFHGQTESLESSMFLNMTQRAAYRLKDAAANLDKVVIVPNPFNISASELQYTGEPNKIMFKNLPIECTIRIFTESGDLIKTIDHYGSGDEPWGVLQVEHMTTDSDQIIVSGIYIAHIETPDGDSTIKKFVIVR